MPNNHLPNGLFSHGGREKYPPAALNWVFVVQNLVNTYTHSKHLASKLLGLFLTIVKELCSHCMPPWERHHFNPSCTKVFGTHTFYELEVELTPMILEMIDSTTFNFGRPLGLSMRGKNLVKLMI